MPFFANQNRDQLRQVYVDAWRKHCGCLPLSPLEAQIADVISQHPEYQPLFSDSDAALDKDWTPEMGATNPFLHMGLHLAVRDQIASDRPAGIRAAHLALLNRIHTGHDVEHSMIECLAEALWNAQRSGTPPDEVAYVNRIKGLAGIM
jgi:hypothetical protein